MRLAEAVYVSGSADSVDRGSWSTEFCRVPSLMFYPHMANEELVLGVVLVQPHEIVRVCVSTRTHPCSLTSVCVCVCLCLCVSVNSSGYHGAMFLHILS